MKTKLQSYIFFIALCLCFNYGTSQTNLILNGTHDEFTVTSADVDANPTWTRNDSDNADAFDMTPSSTLIYDVDAMSGGATSPSPYRALWNNSDLDTWLGETIANGGSGCGDNSELPASSSDGNWDYSAGTDMGVKTRGLKLSEPCRRLYQKVAVTSGISYTLFLESRSEAMGIDTDLYILNTEIVDETGLNGTVGGVVDAFYLINNDFNEDKSNATTDNFTKTTLVFTATTSSIVVYLRNSLATSSTEVFFDNIELYETSALSVDNVLASNLSVYPNPASTNITIKSSQAEIASVELYNILGLKVLATKSLVNDAIDISDMASGVYLLKVNSDTASVTKRIVIE